MKAAGEVNNQSVGKTDVTTVILDSYDPLGNPAMTMFSEPDCSGITHTIETKNNQRSLEWAKIKNSGVASVMLPYGMTAQLF